ncbi:hypothetical protein [Mesorhizobium sp. M0772]|uniref:hypothetical protein n=1 Tax=Mesorhizobium sp. M0772 TaxID=2956998 RepID=UPI00333D6B1D
MDFGDDDEKRDDLIAAELGLTRDELDEAIWRIQENASDDELTYSFIIIFDPSTPAEILAKVEGLNRTDLSVHISVNTFDEPDPEDFS